MTLQLFEKLWKNMPEFDSNCRIIAAFDSLNPVVNCMARLACREHWHCRLCLPTQPKKSTPNLRTSSGVQLLPPRRSKTSGESQANAFISSWAGVGGHKYQQKKRGSSARVPDCVCLFLTVLRSDAGLLWDCFPMFISFVRWLGKEPQI